MPGTQTKKRIVNIALLCCGEFTGKLLKENGDYLAFHTRWLRRSLPRGSKTRPKVEAYKVYQEDHPLPEDDEIDDYDAILVSGSRMYSLGYWGSCSNISFLAEDAWADEPAWIPRLVNFLKKVGTKFPEVRIVG